MTTKFLDNKSFKFKILLSWRFPRKTAFLDDFPLYLHPQPPLESANFISIVVSQSLKRIHVERMPGGVQGGGSHRTQGADWLEQDWGPGDSKFTRKNPAIEFSLRGRNSRRAEWGEKIPTLPIGFCSSGGQLSSAQSGPGKGGVNTKGFSSLEESLDSLKFKSPDSLETPETCTLERPSSDTVYARDKCDVWLFSTLQQL